MNVSWGIFVPASVVPRRTGRAQAGARGRGGGRGESGAACSAGLGGELGRTNGASTPSTCVTARARVGQAHREWKRAQAGATPGHMCPRVGHLSRRRTQSSPNSDRFKGRSRWWWRWSYNAPPSHPVEPARAEQRCACAVWDERQGAAAAARDSARAAEARVRGEKRLARRNATSAARRCVRGWAARAGLRCGFSMCLQRASHSLRARALSQPREPLCKTRPGSGRPSASARCRRVGCPQPRTRHHPAPGRPARAGQRAVLAAIRICQHAYAGISRSRF